MSSDRNGTGRFQERLLVELKQVVSEQAARQPALAAASTGGLAARLGRPRLAAAGLTAVGTTGAVALMLTVGGAGAAAFAVDEQDDGMVRIEISDLRDADGLEGALAEAGIPATVDYLPEGMMCRQPRFAAHDMPGGDGPEEPTSAAVGGVDEEGGASTGGGMAAEWSADGESFESFGGDIPTGGVPSGGTVVEIGTDEDGQTYAAFTLDPAEFRDGRSLVIETTGSDDVSGLSIATGDGEVLPCVEIEIPADQLPPEGEDGISDTEEVSEGRLGEHPDDGLDEDVVVETDEVVATRPAS
ncbi:hypothetical protein FHR81_002854 [Actinoalloteichus hoggarensis]|uniref:Uncharacterized protein n=1 Tax=Actinoalloteichus hoggarensis TaxID=1470176 RepID=A0A221VY73_9PSEU|nr:hypothetical protein [Actinoalloteichus hoggarensis]ASO18447.1 hypothetical protein AHOG_03955 [Actinoalloteichus hoggarensis]MBB5921814.1 hypothetical protein [Actinoalloteichus hoggarensis]